MTIPTLYDHGHKNVYILAACTIWIFWVGFTMAFTCLEWPFTLINPLAFYCFLWWNHYSLHCNYFTLNAICVECSFHFLLSGFWQYCGCMGLQVWKLMNVLKSYLSWVLFHCISYLALLTSKHLLYNFLTSGVLSCTSTYLKHGTNYPPLCSVFNNFPIGCILNPLDTCVPKSVKAVVSSPSISISGSLALPIKWIRDLDCNI